MTSTPLKPFLSSGDAVTGSILRAGVTQFKSITLRKFAGMTFLPTTSKWAYDTFGEQVTMAALAYVDWPDGATLLPIQPGDSLVTGGVTVPIAGVKSRPGIMVTLLVQLRPGL